MYELKKTGKVFTSKFVGTGPSSYKKIIYRAAVSQTLRNTDVEEKIIRCSEKEICPSKRIHESNVSFQS